jgi:hypothetical protein
MVDMLSSCVRIKVAYGVEVPMSPNRKAIVSSESPFRETKLLVVLQPLESLPTCYQDFPTHMVGKLAN